MNVKTPLQLIPLIGLMFISIGCQQPTGSGKALNDDTSRILSFGASGDLFGYSVSISGDYAIVGANKADPHGITDSGAAYIFHRTSSDSWVEKTIITASDKTEGDNFGISVSISGDYVIVGAAAGEAAYIFHRTDAAGWDRGTKLTASDGVSSGDKFGGSVSLYGDYAIVGAANADPGSRSDAGAAYIFYRTGTNTWDAGTKIIASDKASHDYFGCSVSITTDYAAIGAFGGETAYIYKRTATNTWGFEEIAIASDGTAADYFGRSVSISEEYTVVGADGNDSAYVFNRTDDTTNIWDGGTKITASDGASGDYFGQAVSISGDNILVGAYRNDVAASSDAGAAYIYSRIGTNIWDSGTKVVASDTARADYDYYGRSVNISSGYFILGAPGADVDGNANAGRAFIENL